MQKIKAIIAGALLACAIAWPARSAETQFNIGDFVIALPLMNTEGVYLYDFIEGRGLAGVETPIIAWKGFELSGGAVTTGDFDGIPFMGLRHEVDSGLLQKPIYVGIWAARDFRNAVYRAGIKCSIALWEID